MDTSPLRIGYCLSLSGALGSNGKTARLAHQIWQENVNANGGLLGRAVELLCLDDQTNPKLVADLYQRLLDVEKVDVVVGGYGDNSVDTFVKTGGAWSFSERLLYVDWVDERALS